MKKDQINSMEDVFNIAQQYNNTDKDVQKCLDRLQKIENVPPKTAHEFSKRFGSNENITKFQAVKNLIQYVNQ